MSKQMKTAIRKFLENAEDTRGTWGGSRAGQRQLHQIASGLNRSEGEITREIEDLESLDVVETDRHSRWLSTTMVKLIK